MKEQEFKRNKNFYYLLYFIVERQNIFWRKYFNHLPPWSKDPIFNEYKFTNVYRSLDRVSQYMLSNVIYNGKEYSREDMIWRLIVFRHFNKINTWRLLVKKFGDVDAAVPFDAIGEYLRNVKAQTPIYSNAYLQTASFLRRPKYVLNYGIDRHAPKHKIYLMIFKKYLWDFGGMNKLLASKSLKELFTTLLEIPGIANFLAMQYATDFNWSQLFNFSENDHIAVSLGSMRGIERTFELGEESKYEDVIRWVQANLPDLLKEYGLYEDFEPLPGRWPTLMDIQNCFCETDKYLRGAGIKTPNKEIAGKRIKRKYQSSVEPINYKFPPDWGVTL